MKKAITFIIIASFMLTSAPVGAYADLYRADKLKTRAAAERDGGAVALKDELIKYALNGLRFVWFAGESVNIGGADAKTQGQNVGRTATLGQQKDLKLDTAINGHSNTRNTFVTDQSRCVKFFLPTPT